MSFRQRPGQSMFLLAESVGDPSSLVTPLRDTIRRLDANLLISNVRTMEELYRLRAIVVMSVVISLIGAMGTMGLGLAIAGLYGLVAYAASRRTKEIGIRMALGAGQSDVLRMVLRQGMDWHLPGSASVCWPAWAWAVRWPRRFPAGRAAAELISSRSCGWRVRCSPSRCLRPMSQPAARRASVRRWRCGTSSTRSVGLFQHEDTKSTKNSPSKEFFRAFVIYRRCWSATSPVKAGCIQRRR